MMTREELYGGAVVLEFPTSSSTIQLPPHFDTRVVALTGDDLGPGTVTLRLPDPKTIRQHGWLVFMIFNDTSITVNVETATGTVLGFLTDQQTFLVGLISAEFPVGGGTWSLVKKNTDATVAPPITESVCFGSSVGLNDDCNSYLYAPDAWVTNPSLPIVSGTGVEISAGQFPNVGLGSIDAYYGQNAEFYRWINGVETIRSTPSFPFIQTGLGVITGSSIGDLMHVATAAGAPANAYKMEVFDVPLDAWTNGLDFPSFTGITAPEVTVCQSIGVEEFNQFAFTSPSTLDSSAVFIAYDQTAQVYLVAAYPPWPRGPYRPSCVGIDSRLHFQGGSYSSALTVENSTDRHLEFNPFLNTWQVLPPIPVIGRGLGILDFGEPRDRYTFGMGETTSVPSEVHFEYNIVTRTYRNRATFSWGATGRIERESAWGMFQA